MADKVYLTTSWDDGSVNDLRLLKLLNQYSVKGTFYVPQNFPGKDGKYSAYSRRLSIEEIKTISLTQELGAHSLSHSDLTVLTGAELQKEVAESKTFLEEIIGKKVQVFSFPGGKFNDGVIDEIKTAGYLGARATKQLNFKTPNESFSLGVSVQCSPFPFRKKDANKYYWKKIFNPLSNYGYELFHFASLIPDLYSWQSFARAFLKYVMEHGNYFHLWGHSWEIEKYGMWPDLENFLKYVSHRKDCIYLTNGDLMNRIKKKDKI